MNNCFCRSVGHKTQDRPVFNKRTSLRRHKAGKASSILFKFTSLDPLARHTLSVISLRWFEFAKIKRQVDARFYSEKFNWSDEVVSVRLGRRLSCRDAEFLALPKKQFKGFKQMLKVEDPIEITRNLNFALRIEKCTQMRDALERAARELKAGGALGDLISLQADELVTGGWETNESNVTGLKQILCNRLPVGAVASITGMRKGSTGQVGCLECFGWLPNSTALQQHQNLTNHTGALLPISSNGLLQMLGELAVRATA